MSICLFYECECKRWLLEGNKTPALVHDGPQHLRKKLVILNTFLKIRLFLFILVS